jgi:hypothetical protein
MIKSGYFHQIIIKNFTGFPVKAIKKIQVEIVTFESHLQNKKKKDVIDFPCVNFPLPSNKIR